MDPSCLAQAAQLWDEHAGDAAAQMYIVALDSCIDAFANDHGNQAQLESHCRQLADQFNEAARLVSATAPRVHREVVLTLEAALGSYRPSADGSLANVSAAWRGATIGSMLSAAFVSLVELGGLFDKWPSGEKWSSSVLVSMQQCLEQCRIEDAVNMVSTATSGFDNDEPSSAEAGAVPWCSITRAARWLSSVCVVGVGRCLAVRLEAASTDARVPLTSLSSLTYNLMLLLLRVAQCFATVADGSWRNVASQVAAVQGRLDHLESEDAARIDPRRKALPKMGNAAAAAGKDFWQTEEWTDSPDAELRTLLEGLWRLIALKRHPEESTIFGVEAVADAVGHTAAASIVVEWHRQTYRSTATDHSTGALVGLTRRERRLSRWAARYHVKDVLLQTAAATPALPHPALLNQAAPTDTLHQAMSAMHAQQDAEAARRALVVTLCSSSDEEEEDDAATDGDNVTSTSVGTGGEIDPSQLLNNTSDKTSVWLPPHPALAVLRMGLFSEQAQSEHSRFFFKPSALFEERVLVVTAALRSKSTHAIALGLVELAHVVLRHPRYAIHFKAVDLEELPRDFETLGSHAAAPGTESSQVYTDRFVSWCETPEVRRYFLLCQELVTTAVTCAAPELARLSRSIINAVILLLRDTSRLCLVTSLAYRCPYPDGCVLHLRG